MAQQTQEVYKILLISSDISGRKTCLIGTSQWLSDDCFFIQHLNKTIIILINCPPNCPPTFFSMNWTPVCAGHAFKGAVSYFTHIFFPFFLAFLQTSYGFSLIKTYKLHYFYLILYSETTDRGEITVTTTFTSGLDLCIFPCFKYIVYQINSFALIAKCFLRMLFRHVKGL